MRHRPAFQLALHCGLTAALATGCQAGTRAHPELVEPHDFAPPPDAEAAPREPVDLGRWQGEIRSPRQPETIAEPALAARCGLPDAALQAVADQMARGDRDAALDMPALEFELRVAGAPYVWPHVWTVASTALEPEDVARRFDHWLASFADGGDRRCGLARHRDESGRDRIVAVVADALADLSPLPSHSSVGRWLELKARLVAPVSDASVLLLAPRGRPHTVLSQRADNVVTARFAPSEPGRWLVQVVARTESGPRPVASAVIHVDAAPPQQYVSAPVPGETAARPTDPADVALARMINAARASEGTTRLTRSNALDAVAQAHAESMVTAGRLGHDVGRGNVLTRLASAGVTVDAAGENVARAGSVERAHRVLWESPSHRDTLLYDRYDALGVGVAEAEDGAVWVCSVFARF